MKFYNNGLFHIYNQGNNKRTIFFNEENYTFFIWKMRAYLLPFGNLIAYCLMPNHFHWLFEAKKVVIPRKELFEHRDRIEYQRRRIRYRSKARLPTTYRKKADEYVTLQDAIGFLTKSYAKALNNEKEWTGSLFKMKAKAKDGLGYEFRPSEDNLDNCFLTQIQYGYACMEYIHNNPVAAGLADKAEDWPFSSAKDYTGLRNGTLCNLEIGKGLSNNFQPT